MAKENPVTITASGKEDTVLIGYDAYREQLRYIRELEARLNVYTHFSQAEDDIHLGNVQSANRAFTEIYEELEHLGL